MENSFFDNYSEEEEEDIKTHENNDILSASSGEEKSLSFRSKSSLYDDQEEDDLEDLNDISQAMNDENIPMPKKNIPEIQQKQFFSEQNPNIFQQYVSVDVKTRKQLKQIFGNDFISFYELVLLFQHSVAETPSPDNIIICRVIQDTQTVYLIPLLLFSNLKQHFMNKSFDFRKLKWLQDDLDKFYDFTDDLKLDI